MSLIDIIYSVETGNKPNQLNNNGFHIAKGNIAIKMMASI